MIHCDYCCKAVPDAAEQRSAVTGKPLPQLCGPRRQPRRGGTAPDPTHPSVPRSQRQYDGDLAWSDLGEQIANIRDALDG